MPCRDGGPSDEEVMRDTQERLDLVTRLLCSTLKYLARERQTAFVDVQREVDGLAPWFIQHQADDARREAEEKRAVRHRISELERGISRTQSEIDRLKKRSWP